jgi:thiamine biosynthesis lipoprotein
MKTLRTTISAGKSRLAAAAAFALAGVFQIAGCGAPAPLAIRGTTMGTTYEVKLAARPPGIELASLQADIASLLEQINNQMSTYRPESEVCRFSRAAKGEWFSVSAATAEVVAAALDVSDKTGGALDITVGRLVRLWGFGPGDGETRGSLPAGAASPDAFTPPSQDAVDAARAAAGYRRLAVRADPPALRKEVAELEIDLSAVAKGYGVDRVALLLEQRGIRNYMVQIGGETRAAGRRPDGRPWQIGIERPVVDRREVQTIVPLVDAALATSGDYRNYHEYGGRLYAHIIDPATGRPVVHTLASASVIADTCMAADAWATALVVLGPERGYDCAEEHGLAALFIARRETGFDMRTTTAWQARLRAERAP